MKEKNLNTERTRPCTTAVMVIISLLTMVSFGLAVYVLYEVQNIKHDRQLERVPIDNDNDMRILDLQFQNSELSRNFQLLTQEVRHLKLENVRLQENLVFSQMRNDRQLQTIREMLMMSRVVHVVDRGSGAATNSTEEPNTATHQHNNVSAARNRRSVENPTVGQVAVTSCLQGQAGRDGRDGRDGQQGPPGASGITAEDMKEILSSFKESIVSVKPKPEVMSYNINGSGTVYVRWGRTTCPPTANLVYDGIAGGSYFSHTGGGTEKVCLPHQPQWGKYQDGFQSQSYMYGAEYQIAVTKVFNLDNTKGVGLDNHDVPCAVCHTPARSTQLMIPAWKDCPASWVKEYNGYLMAEHYTHQRSSFNCMDEAPEVYPGGQTNTNGALFYNVEASCGALPCPKYVNGRELTCVVCTK